MKLAKKQKQTRYPLLNFFYIYGLDLDCSTSLDDNNLFPRVLSSFSIQGNTKEFTTLSDTISNDPFLPFYIFPNKDNCLSDFDVANFDDDEKIIQQQNQNLNESIMMAYRINYIKYTFEKPFFHCFCFQHCENKDNYLWYFNCLIFYEKTKTEGKCCYAAKAMIIITKEPLFFLCKEILFDIYNRSKNLSPTPYFTIPPIPLEPFIIQLFSQLKSESSHMLNIEINSQIKYKTSMESFISLCDLDYSLFFELFSVKDVLFLIEQFLQRKTIIVNSTSIEYLYPLYHILLTLIHPLDILDNTYCYRIFSDKYLQILLSPMPYFVFIYLENLLDESFFKKLTIKKEADLTVITITSSQTSFLSNKPFNIQKQYYRYNGSQSVNVGKFNNEPVIEKIFNELNEEMDYITMIDTEVQELLKDIDIQNKSNFFQWTGKDYSLLRRLFFGLTTKLCVLIVPQVKVSIEDNRIIFNLIEMINDDDDNSQNPLAELFKNPLLKEFYDNYTSSPSSDIFLKNDKNIYHPNLKNMILIDELLKITSLDKNRLYYDFNSSSSGNQFCFTEIKVNTFEVFKSNKLRYLNKYNKVYNRNNSKRTFHLAVNASNDYFFIYDYFVLYFSEFKDEHNKALQSDLVFRKMIEKQDILFYELNTFYNLLITNTIPFNDLKEASAGLAGLMLSFMILNEESMKIYFDQLINIFNLTKGFYHKFNINLSMIYEILITHQELYDKYVEDFLNNLIAFDLLPTYNIYLKYDNEVKSKIRSIANHYISLNNVNVDIVKVLGCDRHGDIKNLQDTLLCNTCLEPLFIQFSYNKNKREILFCHPRITIEELLRKMIVTQSVIVDPEYFIDEFYDDIGRIAFLMKAYFNINLFN